MAAPEYVPRPADEVARVYGSPPWRPESWTADRPGDLRTRQPVGDRLGRPGPDQGYVLRLARQFEGTLVLADGEHEVDAIAGCVGVALKRASLFGRAPVVHDLTIAFTVWGFLSGAPDDLVAVRRPLFAEVANPHHNEEARLVVDLVDEATLRQSPDEVRDQASGDWRSLIAEPGERPPEPEPGPVAVAEPEPVAVAVPEPDPEPEPEPVAVAEPEPEPVAVAEPEPEPVAVAEPEPDPDPEPSPGWSPPADAPPPAMRPAAKAAPQAVSTTRPTAKKKVVKKKVVKKIIKKKAIKKKVAKQSADGSLFAQPGSEGGAPAPTDEARKRARDLGKDS
jgi:hypothetical protein